MWQDWVLMLGGFIFAPSLVASIAKKVKYPKLTTWPTAVVLTAFVIVYISLGLYLAAITTGLTAVCWYTLALRRS